MAAVTKVESDGETKPELAPPAVSDPVFYSVRDLDEFPRALVPLRLDPHTHAGAGSAGGRLLLWLRIDEQGRIVEVGAGEPGIPDAVVDAARASLAAVQFTPARKDERPVKSRIQISIAY